jgi:hypothetical protein
VCQQRRGIHEVVTNEQSLTRKLLPPTTPSWGCDGVADRKFSKVAITENLHVSQVELMIWQATTDKTLFKAIRLSGFCRQV